MEYNFSKNLESFKDISFKLEEMSKLKVDCNFHKERYGMHARLALTSSTTTIHFFVKIIKTQTSAFP